MHGVIAAVPTPVNSKGEVQTELFLSHCQWVLDNGCDGLNILGSTGEANSFDNPTRKSIMSLAAENLDVSRLMVGTGTPSLSETIDLTNAAEDSGYSVALVLPPFYYKPLSDDGLYDWYAKVHQSLGDRKIAIYFYNFPQMTGLEIPINVIERLHNSWPDRFKGIKDSSGNLQYCRDLADTMPNLEIFPSSEVSLVEAHKSGFAGCISATTNQTGALSAQLWNNRENPDPALVDQIKYIRETIAGNALIPSIKYLVGKQSGNSEWENLIPPFVKLADDRKSELDNLFKKLSEV